MSHVLSVVIMLIGPYFRGFRDACIDFEQKNHYEIV